MPGGRGEIRGGYFTREERALLERALCEGQVCITASACQEDRRVAESLFQRGYLRSEQNGETIRFTPSSVAAKALKAAGRFDC